MSEQARWHAKNLQMPVR